MLNNNNNEFDYEKNTWDVIDKFLGDPKFMIENQINSYDELIMKTIPGLIKHHSPVIVGKNWDEETGKYLDRYELHFDHVYISKPLQHNNINGYQPLYPNEARLRDLTYSGPVFIDYHQVVYQHGSIIDVESEQKVPIWKMPIMINSKMCYLNNATKDERKMMGECPFDYGGYFIINGSEKVVIAQERQADNNLMIYKAQAKYPYIYYAEILSTLDHRYFPIKPNKVFLCRPKTKVSKSKDIVIPGYKLEVKIPAINSHEGRVGIPLFIVFKALGIISDKEIIELIIGDLDNTDQNSELLNLIIPSANDALNILTQDDAILYLSKKANVSFNQDPTNVPDNLQLFKYTKSILNREFLSHVGPDNYKKAIYLGYIVRKLLMVFLNPELLSDRDHYSNKRVNLTGHLLNDIIRPNFTKLILDIKDSFKKCFENKIMAKNPNIRKLIQKCNIESRLKYALSTGNWYTQIKHNNQNSEGKKGIAQVLQRMAALGTISNCRRVKSPLEKSMGKIEAPRRYHFTQIGKICPQETPEGQEVGITKNLALSTHITLEGKTEPLRMYLSELGVIDITIANSKLIATSTNVLINGDLIGIIIRHEDTFKIYKGLKLLKLNGKINIFTSIALYIEKNELIIQTDGGRYCRPLYLLKNNNYKINNWIKWATDKGIDFQDYLLNKLKWEDFLFGLNEYDNNIISETSGAMIEYIDTNEEECSLIAVFPYQLIPGKENFINNNIADIQISYLNSEITINPENPKETILNNLDQKWHLLMNNIKVEYLNKEYVRLTLPKNANNEQITLVKFFTRFLYNNFAQYTHAELHPALWHSIVAQMIPFPDHNPAPRNCYQTSMAKQSLGIYASNFTNRMDTNAANILTYPQFPLVDPRTIRYSPLAHLPHGYQTIVAIMIYSGYNQEDSIIMNKGSIEAGLFNSIHYRTYEDQQQNHKTNGANDEKYGISSTNKLNNSAEYHAIDKDTGLPIIGTYVKEDDIILSKYKKSINVNIYDDLTKKSKDNGIIDYIIPNERIINENGDGNKFVKIRISSLRQPEIGDKFASRCAQKGTVSMIYNRADMPFTVNGVSPEIIMNAHAIPSRATIAMLLEALFGKLGSLSGRNRDATPFTHFDLNVYKEELANYGFDYNGNEFMFNGKTGEFIEAAIFINPCYYQKLKHMIGDKIHSRDSGPVQLMTRQPAEGRARDGGLRIGEMERDCFIAHGAATYLKEKMTESSDIFQVYHSNTKGDIIACNPADGIYKYGNNNIYETDEIDSIIYPFAFNLLCNENKTIYIDTILET